MYCEFNTSLRKCLSVLEKIKYYQHVGTINSLKPSSELLRLTKYSAKYTEVYDVAIRNNDFNFVLSDSSFFQFSESSDGVRFAYYPNPYKFVEYESDKKDALEMLNNNEISPEDYEQLLSESKFMIDTPAIRYDLSYKQYCKDFHPTAHLHVGLFVENRWPVKRHLTPYAFLLKVLSIYYVDLWKEKNLEDDYYLQNEYKSEAQLCSLISEENFTAEEARKFSFG
jgi:hypothetical protein